MGVARVRLARLPRVRPYGGPRECRDCSLPRCSTRPRPDVAGCARTLACVGRLRDAAAVDRWAVRSGLFWVAAVVTCCRCSCWSGESRSPAYGRSRPSWRRSCSSPSPWCRTPTPGPRVSSARRPRPAYMGSAGVRPQPARLAALGELVRERRVHRRPVSGRRRPLGCRRLDADAAGRVGLAHGGLASCSWPTRRRWYAVLSGCRGPPCVPPTSQPGARLTRLDIAAARLRCSSTGGSPCPAGMRSDDLRRPSTSGSNTSSSRPGRWPRSTTCPCFRSPSGRDRGRRAAAYRA